jgi:hypothetical protein
MSNAFLQGLRSWWTSNGRAYLTTVAVCTVIALATAAAVGVDRVMNAGLQVFGVALALPFVVALAIILLCAIIFLPLLLLALLLESDIDIGGDFIADLAARIIGGYFGWFARRRDPMFWGSVSGALVALGVLALIS